MRRLILLLPLLSALAGCAPHPATGLWVAAEGADSPFTRLDVDFQGWAELFRNTETKEVLRCFWAGANGESIRLTCRGAEDEEAEEHYRLVVTGEAGAELKQEERVVARFVRG